MDGKQRKYLGLGLVGAFLIGGWQYATPYITLYQMYDAAKKQDFQGVATHVDFLALRDSVKANVNSIVQTKSIEQNNPLMGLVGAALSGFLLNPVVDAVVTPEGVTGLLLGQRILLNPTEGQGADQSQKPPDVDVKPRYESFDRFVVGVKPKGEDLPPVDIILHREGLGWKVTGLRLPEGFLPNRP
jgi:hypothetical protein